MATRRVKKERQVNVTLKRKVPASQAAAFKAQAQAMGYKTTVAKRKSTSSGDDGDNSAAWARHWASGRF